MNIENKSMYSAADYDSNFALKLSFSAWLIIIFTLRPFVIFIASVSNKSDRFGLLNTLYPDPLWALVSAIASIPVIILLIAWAKRGPCAGQPIRRIWRNGRWLLSFSLILNAGAFITPWLLGSNLSNIDKVQIGTCGILLYVLLRSIRIRDAFTDFPNETIAVTQKAHHR